MFPLTLKPWKSYFSSYIRAFGLVILSVSYQRMDPWTSCPPKARQDSFFASKQKCTIINIDQSFGSFPRSETPDRLGSTGVNRSVGCSGMRDTQDVSLVLTFAPRTDTGTFDDGNLQIYLMENLSSILKRGRQQIVKMKNHWLIHHHWRPRRFPFLPPTINSHGPFTGFKI